ncbi:pyruvate dehydrogenase complex transcriptional repressor PdhR [Hahella sp. KA22]|uniref:pyruvate dehydrogenase complex transcriptional repressor PdhR n=1 Tax=Hahella sp. KA22 TaxID=1628392 RepID=UPI000FDD3C0D|nr:pyruvate dehydrogenase complex transcriptional repressor PdhR [Hahella sp. KA22]AZZ94173.1 pyruvate dehydrogenase complex transcriptional repressor PdhR [Hahella sp. KA22]QAY57547.1 pyruvate dehydrogenase complex transcriptional repressor PdhR [Hahella sp. KA22]
MPVMKPLKQPKLSDVIVDSLEQMILEGSLKPGQRLPPERSLAVQFEVSRPSVREAIQKLEAKGLVVRRQGGGNFVSQELGASYTEPLFALIGQHPEAQYDLLEFRHALEGVAAYYAAIRGTGADRKIIEKRYNDWLNYHEQRVSDLEAKADAEFHLSIAEAAHNVVLLHTMRALFTLLKQNIVSNLHYLYEEEAMRLKIKEQHFRLKEAVLARDPNAARAAAHEHLAYVEEIVLEKGKADSRNMRSLRRLQNLDE